MKYRRLVSLALGFFGVMLCSCTAGLDPYRVDIPNTPVISVSFAGSADASSRALVSGTATVYLRTFGALASAEKRFFGPYSLSSGVVTVTDIPSGEYTSIVVFHSPITMSTALVTALSGTDDSVRELITAGSSDLITHDAAQDGYLAYGASEAVKLEVGVVTPLSVTLVPVCASATTLGAEGTSFTLPANTTKAMRFFRLPASTASVASGTAPVSISAVKFSLVASKGASLSSFTLWDASGKSMSGLTGGSVTSTSGLAWSYSVPLSAIPSLYLGVSWTGSDVTLSYVSEVAKTNTGNSATITVTFDEYGDPDITGSSSETLTASSSVTITASSGYDSYTWYLNGTKLSLSGGTAVSSWTFSPGAYPSLILNGKNVLLLVVSKGSSLSSAAISLTIM